MILMAVGLAAMWAGRQVLGLAVLGMGAVMGLLVSQVPQHLSGSPAQLRTWQLGMLVGVAVVTTVSVTAVVVWVVFAR